jgi:hypothetical protein
VSASMNFDRVRAVGLGLMVLCLSAANGQVTTGTIQGQITDPQGAVVPGAGVTALHINTGVESTVASNETGFLFVRAPGSRTLSHID